MQIKVTKTAQLGQVPEFKLFIDDVEFSFDHAASRVITGTTSESGNGIFTSNDNPSFGRGKTSVTMGKDSRDDIPCCAPLSNEDTPEAICERIREARGMVDKAFADKFPAVSESCSIEL